MTQHNMPRGLLARAPLASAIAFALLAAPAVQAFDFEKGGLTGSLDTTISYGISVRTQDPAVDLIGKAHFNPAICAQNVVFSIVNPCTGGFPGSPSQIAAPGRFSVNRDDGDLKYGKGDAFSNAFKITSELSLKWGNNWGVFTRATYFYDFENATRSDLTAIARQKSARIPNYLTPSFTMTSTWVVTRAVGASVAK